MHVPFSARSTRALAAAALALAATTACKKDKTNEASGDVTPGAAAATPTTSTSTVRVADIDVGRSVQNSRVADKTDNLRARDTVYASVHTTGASPNATVMARWTFEDGQVVQEQSQSIAPTGDAYTEFHISKPGGLPAGKYKVEVFLDNKSVGTKDFTIK